MTGQNNIAQITYSRFQLSDSILLKVYLQNLSPQTAKRFGPHRYDEESIIQFYQDTQQTIGYIASDKSAATIIAYTVVRIGYLDHDLSRLEQYGKNFNKVTDCTFAPSVADKWQGKGIGSSFFNLIKDDLEKQGIKRMILWGGVQADNERALNFYLKNGFYMLGEFEYYGNNYDMMLDL